MSSDTMTPWIGRGLWIAAALAIAALAAGMWWVWGQHPGPAASLVPPELSSPDPGVAAGLTATRQRVLREPQSAAAWGAYGEVLLANGFRDEAATCLAQAEKLDPTEPRWPYLRGYDVATIDRPAALQAFRRAAELSDNGGGAAAAAPWMMLVEVYMERDDRQQVEACCRHVLDRDPENARAHFALGMSAFLHDDMDVSIPHLLIAAKSPSVRQRAYTQLAAAYQRQQNDVEAPRYALLAQQAPADAPWYDPYVAHLDDLKLGAEMRFRLVKDLGTQSRLTEQAAVLRRMVDENHDERANLDLGIVLTELGDFDHADPILQRAVNHYGAAGDPSYFLGVERYQKAEKLEASHREQAADLFQASADATRQATIYKPDHAMAHYFHGLALEKLGRPSEAIESLRTAARCRPEVFDIQLVLGKALAANGQQGEAQFHLKEACELAPDDARSREALALLQAAPRKE